MPTPNNLPDEEISPDARDGRRPSWWRRALAALLRALARGSRSVGRRLRGRQGNNSNNN
jgi:hypothetical protein